MTKQLQMTNDKDSVVIYNSILNNILYTIFFYTLYFPAYNFPLFPYFYIIYIKQILMNVSMYVSP